MPRSLEKRVSVNRRGCWVVVKGTTTAGYGQVQVNNKKMYAHRYMYEQCIGPIPDGKEIHHKCKTKACCKPSHLRPITRLEHKRIEPRGPHPVRTHCRRGHRLTVENTYFRRRDRARICRTCERARQRVPGGYGPRRK